MRMTHFKTLLAVLIGCGSLAGSASGAIIFNFANASGTFDGSVSSTAKLTVGSLADGTPTDTDPGGLAGRTTLTGSLSGVDNSVSFDILYDTFSGSSLSGTNVTLSGVSNSFMASNSTTGIASADGDINAAGRGIYFEFDFSSFAPNTGLRITDFTATSTGGSNHDAQIIVDNVSVTNLGGLTGSGLSIDIADGDVVVFRNAAVGSATDRFRVTSITVEAFQIPEPGSLALIAFGGLLVARRRRR